MSTNSKSNILWLSGDYHHTVRGWIFARAWAQISVSQLLECYVTQRYPFKKRNGIAWWLLRQNLTIKGTLILMLPTKMSVTCVTCKIMTWIYPWESTKKQASKKKHNSLYVLATFYVTCRICLGKVEIYSFSSFSTTNTYSRF